MAQNDWTFGTLSSFFKEDVEPSEERFCELFDAMMFAHGQESLTTAVEEEWLPYALEMLEAWPDETRLWFNRVRWDEEAKQDTFVVRSHPVHALGRALILESINVDFMPYCGAPDIGLLRSLEFYFGFDDPPSASQFAQVVDALEHANLDHLGFAYARLGDELAEILARATHLEGISSLMLREHEIPWPVLKEMLSQPHFKSLRHLSFGVMPHEWQPKAKYQLELLEILPELVTTLEPHNAAPRSRIARHWSGVGASDETTPMATEDSPKTTREKVESALSMYRADTDSRRPFLGDGFLCYGGFVEVSDEDFEQQDLDLATIYPRYAEIAQGSNFEITTVYVVAVREGALERSFDEEGALIMPLELRPMGRYWYGAPEGHDSETYAGGCMLQSVFASFGLHLEAHDDGNLWLTPEDHLHESSLVRFWKACSAASDWVSGWNLDFICTPWNDRLVAMKGHDMRLPSMVVWEERHHRFGRRGDLTTTQPMFVMGDAVPLVRVLRESGFEVTAGRWEIELHIEDTHSSANADSPE